MMPSIFTATAVTLLNQLHVMHLLQYMLSIVGEQEQAHLILKLNIVSMHRLLKLHRPKGYSVFGGTTLPKLKKNYSRTIGWAHSHSPKEV